MNIYEAFVLLAAGVAGGIFSTVVSNASLVTYPVLLALGLPPVMANMTNTVSLVLTGAGAVAGSRPELDGQYRRALRLATVTTGGGAAGATILLIAPSGLFTMVVPVLIAGASLLLLVQPRLTRLAAPAASQYRARNLIALFAVSVYIGYFGAAGGVMFLVALGAMIAEPLIRVNALKNTLTGTANFMAAACFAAFGAVRWAFVPPLAAGYLAGGWLGPKIARRIPVGPLRLTMCLCGVGLAVKLGTSAYL